MNRRDLPFTLIAAAAVCALLTPGAAAAVPAVSFAPTANYPVSWGSNMVAAGDLNHDGNLDLVVTNNWAGSISMLLGTGGGAFGASSEYGAVSSPSMPIMGDLNNDGNLDVVVTDYSGACVSIYFGHGDGTLGARVDLGVPSSPASCELADLDHDGALDLVVSLVGADVMGVFMGHGDGTFAPRADVPVAASPFTFALQDFDRDGRTDILVVCYSGREVDFLTGNGAGSFGSAVAVATTDIDHPPDWLRAADLNRDGALDFVLREGGLLGVFIGQGDGTFAPAEAVASVGSPSCFTLGEMNGDGVVDIVVPSGNQVAIVPGLGDGTFGTPAYFPVGAQGATATAADLNRDHRTDVMVPNWYSQDVSVLLNTTVGASIAPQPAATCISPVHACVDVPVAIARTDATPVRGFSVDVQLSGNLSLCGAGVAEGTYLSGGAAGRSTSFHTVDRGSGTYTIDGAILGLPCGATDPAGTLFTLHLGSGVPGGTGTVSVTQVTLRDCSNGALAAFAGTPASIAIDNVVPAAVTLLAAAQATAGNTPGDSTTAITLSWPAVEAGASVELWRRGFGNYPEYDDPPGAGAAPAPPVAHPPAGWTLAGTVSGATSWADHPGTRDFWYYVAYVVDACGNVSAASNRTNGTLDYHLGDVANGSPGGTGNNVVGTEDISLLGANYGVTLAVNDPVHALDVGPTTDYSVNARPMTDNKVNFEDLMMFSINYGVVSAPQLAVRRMRNATAANALTVEAPAAVDAGESFAATLRWSGGGEVQGVSAQLDWDRSMAEPVSVEAGPLIDSRGGLVLSGRPGNVDAALLGVGHEGLTGDGTLAVVRFRALQGGDPRVTLAAVEARDVANQPVTLTTPVAAPAPADPARTALMAARPNPFNGMTTLGYALAVGGPVELSIYTVGGRKVRTLVRESQPSGWYEPVWDGRDERGDDVRAGVYYARLLTPAGRFTRTVVRMR